MNFLLGVTMEDFLTRTSVVCAIVFAGIGLAVTLLAPKFGKKMSGTNADQTRYTNIMRVAGLLLMLLGAVLIGIESVTGIIANS